MTNPDNDIKSSTMPSPLFNLLTIVFNIVLFMGLYFLGNYYKGFNTLFIWIVFPILSYALSFGMNVWNQSSNCHNTNIKLAALGALPMIATIYISLFISAVSFCRIPIISVLTPLLYDGEKIDVILNKSNNLNNNSNKNNNIKSRIKECCPSKMTLEQIENDPNSGAIIKGLAMSFYIIFGVMFGNVFSFSLSAIC